MFVKIIGAVLDSGATTYTIHGKTVGIVGLGNIGRENGATAGRLWRGSTVFRRHSCAR